jgi:hypothetical protein
MKTGTVRRTFGWIVIAICFGVAIGVRGEPAQEPGLKTTLDLTLPGIQPVDADALQRAFAQGEQVGALLNDPVQMRLRESRLARFDTVSRRCLRSTTNLMGMRRSTL